jgi:hypothetical protein
MRYFGKTTAGVFIAGLCLAGAAGAQTPAGSPQAPRSSAVAAPTYVQILLDITVNRSAADVWKRFGKYCAVAEWMKNPCTITSGKEGELGSVRSLGGGEILVGKTELSYTYTQPVKDGQPYNMYHGTFEARPVTATTSKIMYSFVYDNSMLADDAAREADKARRTTSFSERLQNMKRYLESEAPPK